MPIWVSADADLRCGVQPPRDADEHRRTLCTGAAVEQVHNNCSGKHAGFLMLNRALGGGPDYVEPDHPVQRAVRDAFEDMTGAPSPGYGIDGCSAPNFATSVHGLARAMARFAAARDDAASARDRAAARLRAAMSAHPMLVAGAGRACTRLMEAMDGVAVKTGAEGVFVAMLPEQRLGVALKITDGATRASETAIAAILARLGVLASGHPLIRPEIRNWRGLLCGEIRPAPALGPAS